MSDPQQNNGVYPDMNQTEANMHLNNQNNRPMYVPVQTPVYAVPVAAGQGNPVGMPVQAQTAGPMAVPVAYTPQPQPVIIQQPQQTGNQKVIIIQEERNRHTKGCCYCRGPRLSPCGCLDPNEEYCWFLVFGAYVLMSLHYILTCLCIWSFCRNFNRHGWC